ncbi:MAG TPA: hypothetical protein VHT50_04515 [Mycobacterium sp.]|nr:hypothetical protein [Mycobacterium sp.]
MRHPQHPARVVPPAARIAAARNPMLDHLLGVNGLFTDLAGYARTHSIGAPGRALRYGQRTPLVLFSASRLGSHPAHPARPAAPRYRTVHSPPHSAGRPR